MTPVPEGQTNLLNGDPISFHRKLLNDRARMAAYRNAIFQTIVPGSIVLDAGSGTGILALFACQAGAGRVYAIERSSVIEVARTLAEANGFADRIVFIQDEIRNVQLPERVDVLISELIAKAVLGEGLAESVAWCREHCLKPGGTIIPDRVDLWVAPVVAAQEFGLTSLPETEAYGVDFSPMRPRSANRPISARVSRNALLAPGQIAYSHIGAESPAIDIFDRTLHFTAQRADTLHGLVTWFTATLVPGVHLDNQPPGSSSWDNLLFPLPEAVAVRPGTAIELRFRGRSDEKMPDMWAWDTRISRDRQILAEFRQSSFLGQILTSELLRNKP